MPDEPPREPDKHDRQHGGTQATDKPPGRRRDPRPRGTARVEPHSRDQNGGQSQQCQRDAIPPMREVEFELAGPRPQGAKRRAQPRGQQHPRPGQQAAELGQ